MYRLIIFLSAGILFLELTSCKKFVDIPSPDSQIDSRFVFETEESATAVLTGLYSKIMSDGGGLLNGGLTQLAGLSADELEDVSNTQALSEFQFNSISVTNSSNEDLWKQGYKYIYICNSLIEGVKNSTTIPGAVKNQLTGEAKFIRALAHFYLVNLYGDIPYIKTTDYSANSKVIRNEKNTVMNEVAAELAEAAQLMTATNGMSAGERSKPNHWAAIALLSRVYLYLNKWPEAETASNEIISQNSLFQLEDNLNDVFQAGSRETILQFVPNTEGFNTWEGAVFIIDAGSGQVTLSSQQVNGFENNDQRKVAWVNSFNDGIRDLYFPFKYKVKSGAQGAEDYIFLRLAEQFLVKAEALAMQGKITDAVNNINIIRLRAGLPELNLTTQQECIDAVMQERRSELFCEWGHRWFDLKRTLLADPVLTAEKPGWQSTDALYPIPQSQIVNDPAMTQNAGY
jgi:hypothetical protein